MTQVEFSRIFDVHPMTVSKWERGIISPGNFPGLLMHQVDQLGDREKILLKQLVNDHGVLSLVRFILTDGEYT